MLNDAMYPQGTSLVIVQFSRVTIESQSIEPTLHRLNALLDDGDLAWRFRNKLVFLVSGYDDDPREAYEIPEVCQFFGAIHREWKYWFFFVSSSPPHMLVSLRSIIGGAKRIPPYIIDWLTDDTEQFARECMVAMAELFNRWEWPKEDFQMQLYAALAALRLVGATSDLH